MNPDDDRMRDAMHSIEPGGSTAGTDAPDLFERVALGAKRRRHMRTGATVLSAAVVLAAIGFAPTLIRGASSSPGTQTLAGPSFDPDPGFTGKLGPAPTVVVPSATSPAPAVSSPGLANVPPSGLVVPPAQPSRLLMSTPSPLPTNSAGCPTVASISPGADAAIQADAAAIAAVPKRYGADAVAKAHVTSVYAASTGKGYGIVADAICGKALGDNSYVVELSFGDMTSASIGSGQLFVADFANSGWQVWFQYH
jgi:hypothetical protein